MAPFLKMFRLQTIQVYQISCFCEKVNISPQILHISPGLTGVNSTRTASPVIGLLEPLPPYVLEFCVRL